MPSEELSENLDDGTGSDAELGGSVSPVVGSLVRPEQRVPASTPLVAVGSPSGASSSASVQSRHSDDYREHLRIRARALQTEQELLEAGAAAAASAAASATAAGLVHHGPSEVPGSEAPWAPALSPSRTDEIGTARDAILTQTHYTSQRIGELDLALDRLLHRLAPPSSDVATHHQAVETVAPPLAQAASRSGHEVPLPGSPLASPVRLSAAGISAGRQLDYYAVAPPSTDVDVDVDATGPRFQQSVRIDDVERQLTHLQERYQAMATDPGDDASSDTMSCSSLSDDTAISHLDQSHLSDDGTRD